jgi:hypothetical protein
MDHALLIVSIAAVANTVHPALSTPQACLKKCAGRLHLLLLLRCFFHLSAHCGSTTLPSHPT